MSEPMLRVLDLKKYFPMTGGLLKRKIGEVKAVDGVSFDVMKSDTLALVGESGSGKTTVGKMLVRILKPTSGSIFFANEDIAKHEGDSLKNYRRMAQMVFQDPTSSLNPRRKILDIVIDPLNVHKIGLKSERYEMVTRMMDRVELPRDFLYRYPHSLSGGQKQRVGIARAVIMNPALVVLDEPTASLDVSVQANIVSLLKEIQKEYGLTYVFISHNLSLVRNIADWVTVMYLGRAMEMAPTEQLFTKPMHPYTIALLSVVPTVSEEEEKLLPERVRLEGEIPSSVRIPKGCRFASRCPKAHERCSSDEPPLVDLGGHFVRCHQIEEGA